MAFVSAAPPPRPLIAGERVELWLELAPPDSGDRDGAERAYPAEASGEAGHALGESDDHGPVVGQDESADSGADDESDDESDWDVRPARVAAVTTEAIVLQTGGWQLTQGQVDEKPGLRAVVRRFGPEGLAEWEGEIGAHEVAGHLDFGALAALHASPETAVVVRLQPGTGAGRLFQRRRSPRLPVDLTPVRLTPLGGHEPAQQESAPQDTAPQDTAPQDAFPRATLRLVPPAAPTPLHPSPAVGQPGNAGGDAAPDAGLLPVARLTDVSATGAGVVVDYPLSGGTTVSLEFHLPGESTPFAVRGRVVEPAVPIHGDVQPQPDGLPGFRRGVEFIGTAANREARRLAAALSRLLPHHSSSTQ